MSDSNITKSTHRHKINLTGQAFGRLIVLSEGDNYIAPCGAKSRMWLCRCRCGKILLVRQIHLMRGASQSCGCLQRERTSACSSTHRHSNTRLYKIYQGMIRRCTNPKNNRYQNYGGRGITICDRWRNSFMAFLEDMGPTYSQDLSIDRIDNDLGYSPENCRWSSPAEQSNNRRSNRKIEANGLVKTIAQWSKKTGIPHTTIHNRLILGWPEDKAVLTPSRKPGRG